MIRSGRPPQGQQGTRCVALDGILKAHAMSTISQRIRRSQMPGYWAVEIRQSEAAGPGNLCQAQDDPSAAALAGRLMGSALSVRGFNYYRIDKARLEGSGATLPLLGEHRTVAVPAEWAELTAAHDASERAAAAERGGA